MTQAGCREELSDIETERADLWFLKHVILEALAEVGHHFRPAEHSRIKEQARPTK